MKNKKMFDRLPVVEYKDEILSSLEREQILIVVGETGSGKTTQIPQFLVELLQPQISGLMIGCTQPRRVAAITVAQRVAHEMGVMVGEEVGYSVRFDEMTSESTLIKYLTDGMLIRESMYDDRLSKYAAIIIDEAHERTIQTDILLGVLRDICRRRKSLKLIIMSATIDTEKFKLYFDAPIIEIPGRLHEVIVHYHEEEVIDYLSASLKQIFHILDTTKDGDILVFLTGEDEILRVCEQLNISDHARNILPLPLYSALPYDDQQQVFLKSQKRKIVVSTVIAETSVTIDGIVYVVDCGYTKKKIYNPRTRAESLEVIPISQAAAMQRTGRAGRTKPGVCYRIYTKLCFDEFQKQTMPEITLSKLTGMVLTLARIVPLKKPFYFLDPPPRLNMAHAILLLVDLGALDSKYVMTKLGKQMCEFPVEPELAKVLVKSQQFGCSVEVAKICAILTTQNIFYSPLEKRNEADEARKQFEDPYGDHLTLRNIFDEYLDSEKSDSWCRQHYLNPRSLSNAVNIWEQLCDKLFIPPIPQKLNEVDILKCFLTGFFPQLARQQAKRRYVPLMEDTPIQLHRTCKQDMGEFIMYNEVASFQRLTLITCSTVQKNWIMDVAKEYIEKYNILIK